MIFCYIVLPLTGMSKNRFNPQTTYTEKTVEKIFFKGCIKWQNENWAYVVEHLPSKHKALESVFSFKNKE